MANWHYYNTDGEKISVTDKELKKLAQTGKITRGTFVEEPGGRTGLAKDVKGLTFGEPVQPNPTPQTTPPKPSMSSTIEQTEIDKFLAKHGIKYDVKMAEQHGWTLLHEAARFGKVEVVKFLVDMGAAIDIKSISGRTPLDVAKESGNMAVVQYFSSLKATSTNSFAVNVPQVQAEPSKPSMPIATEQVETSGDFEYFDDDDNNGDYYDDYGDDHFDDYGDEPSTSGGRGHWLDELKAIREEPNQLRKMELLRYVEATYGITVDPLTKRWIGIKGY